jgi:hypothetical protein
MAALIRSCMGIPSLVMRIPLAALCVLMLALLVQAPPATAVAAASGATCNGVATKTLAANRQVRIYRGAAMPGEGTGPVYGCLKSSGKSRRMGPLQLKGWDTSMRSPFALKQTWAGAVEQRRPGQDATRVYVTSLDIRKGKGRRCLIGSADRAGQLPSVRLLLIDKAGALAWAAITPSPTGHAPEIGVCDSQGARILDSGAGVEVDSVVLRGSTLSWTNAGGPRSAQLH